MDLMLKAIILTSVPVLVLWGAHVIQQGRIKLTLGFKKHLTGRNARLAGLIAIVESLAAISFVLGHDQSAIWMMSLTIPILCLIAFTEFTEQLA